MKNLRFYGFGFISSVKLIFENSIQINDSPKAVVAILPFIVLESQISEINIPRVKKSCANGPVF